MHILIERPRLYITVHGNFTSIIHHFRDIEVFMLAGNDVIALSPLGNAAGELSLRILIERPRLHNGVSW
jgi:hypothetical protein